MEKVRIISSTMVKPTKCLENPPRIMPTVFDKTMEMVPYQQRVLFYRSAGRFEQHMDLLKKSLAEVLLVFYPLAGRVSRDENGDSVIDCGAGQSVRFIEAVTDSSLEQLGEFRPCEFCDSLCDMGGNLPKYPWKLEDPLLFIQVTRFSCGGISLGFAFNHHVVDGTSAWHFMTSWAEMARIGHVQAPPDITYNFKAPVLTREEFLEQKQKLELTIVNVPIVEKNPFKLVTKLYNLEPEMIQKLKADAATATNGMQFSSFVVIGAYFWKKVTLARQLRSESETCTTRFVIAINCRERIPSLSKRYFGNAISAFAVSRSANDESDWLSQSTTLMHQKIKACDGESLATSMGFVMKVLSDPKELKEFNLTHTVVHPIGSPHHPVYMSDFGFGPPVGVTFGTGDLSDGKLYLFPSARGHGGVTATIVLPTDVMERLSQQED